jgi:hypothetical protein
VIPVFPDSLDSGVLQYADLTAKATEHFSWLATYADRTEALANMLGAFM